MTIETTIKPMMLHLLSGDLWAGKECQVVLQVAALRKLGCEVTILLFNDSETARRARIEGIPTKVIEETNGLASLIRQSISFAKEHAAPVIFAHGHKELLVALAISTFCGGRIVSAFHGAPEFHAGHFGLRQAKLLTILSARKLVSRLFATRCTAVSRQLLEELRLPASKTAIIHNVATPLSSTNIQAPRSNTLVVVGRLVGVKRVSLALMAFDELLRNFPCPEEIKLNIVGDGPDRRDLEQQALRLGLGEKVKFLGFRSDAQNIIAEAKMLLVTSLREGIPTVVLEALYTRTPVVTTPLPGINEILQLLPRVPVIMTPDDSAISLARAMHTLLSQAPTWPEDLSENLVRHFSPAAAASKLIDLCQNVLESQ